MANKVTRITTVAGSIKECASGKIIFSPSRAESTEIAGVIAPSPYISAAPVNAENVTHLLSLPLCTSNDIRAMIPPSPLLSIRMAKMAYLTEVTRISVQMISDNKPRMTSGVGLSPDNRSIVLTYTVGWCRYHQNHPSAPPASMIFPDVLWFAGDYCP